MPITTAYERERELIKGEHELFRRAEETPKAPPQIPGAPRPRWPWWELHGEMLCAIISGLLLLAATIVNWTAAQHTGLYHAFVGIAFALGFFFGASEAWSSLRQGKLDIHFLMVLGAVLAIFVGSEIEGAVLLFLFTLSGALEQYAMQRTHAALESLMKLFPKEAVVLDDDGQQRKVKLEALCIGDRVLVKPGDNVAADGKVLEGQSAIDESAITGEYLPREKYPGMPVYAGTLNTSGRLIIRVEKPASDTTLAKIIHLVSEARDEKAPVERLFDKIGTAYTIAVLLLSIGSALVLHYGMGLAWVHGPSHPTGGAIYRAITLLIVASPCALIISTPVVLLSAIATCARRGIVLKGGRHLESLAALKALVFDKTGTLTRGQVRLVGIEYVSTGHSLLHCDLPGVVSDHPEIDGRPLLEGPHFVGEDAEEGALATMPAAAEAASAVLEHHPREINRLLLRVAASLEVNSSHPLAAAVMHAAKEAGLEPWPVDEFAQEAGQGLRGVIDGQSVIMGSPALLDGICPTLSVKKLCDRLKEIERHGETAVVLYYAGRAGLLRFQDTLRPDAAETLQRLHGMGVCPLIMLTGDNRQVAAGVAALVGVDEVKAELLPQDKLAAVESLVKQHKVVGMVGDGINDAPALARATVGIAMGSIGSDAALEAADVVLLSDRIDRLPWLVNISRRARRVMLQNLAFAIGVIVVLVISSFLGGIGLPLGVIGHEGSTVLVVFNGLRLLIARGETAA